MKTNRSATIRDDQSAGSVVSFIVALGIFVAAFTLLTIFLTSLSSTDTSKSVDLNARAADALGLLVGTPGFPLRWDADARNLSRLGLLEDGTLGRIDIDKIEALARATNTTSATNAYIEYEEAKANLSLDGFDFHLQMRPLGTSGTVDLKNSSVLYIGHWKEGNSDAENAMCPDIPNNSECYSSVNESTALLNLSSRNGLKFTNETFDPDALPTAKIDADKWNDKKVEPWKNSFNLRLAGWRVFREDTTDRNTLAGWHIEKRNTTNGVDPRVGEKFVTPSYWNSSGTRFAYEDTNGTVGISVPLCVPHIPVGAGNCTIVIANDGHWANLSQTVIGAQLTRARLVTPQLDLTNYTGVNVTFLHFANGSLDTLGQEADYGKVEWADSTTVDTDTWSDVISQKFWNNGTLASWEYREANRTFSILDNKKQYFSFAWRTDDVNSSDRQGWLVDNVSIYGYSNTTNTRTLLWSNWNEYNVSLYTTMIIGSNVKQTSLNGARTIIGDWLKANGTIMSLGHPDLPTNINWLSDLVTSGTGTSNSGLFESQSDINHPLLTIPNLLGIRDLLLAANFPVGGKAYDFSAADEALFTKILQLSTGSCPSDCDATYRVSNAGSFGNGTLILTSYTPHNFTNITSREDFFTNNILYKQLARLYLDYGASIAKDNTVGSATRVALMPRTATSTNEFVEVQFTFYLWERGRIGAIR